MSNYENQNYYLKHELHPALNWSSTLAGFNFRDLHPNLSYYMTADPEEESDRCYFISLIRNSIKVVLYIGESSYLSRFYVHCWHLATYPKIYFGIDSCEVDDIIIEFDNKVLPSIEERKARELELRKQLKPVLNPAYLGDRCIPRADRYDVVHNYFNYPLNLEDRIKFLTEKASYLYDYKTFLRKTPCSDNKMLQLPYGLEERVRQYIQSLSRANRSSLILKIANQLGEGFFITQKTAITILSRMLVEDPFDNMNLLISCTEMQIKQRQELLDELKRIS